MTVNLTKNNNLLINVNPGASSDAIPVRCNVGIDSLPNEILKVIFTKIPDHLGGPSQVSKLWNRTIQDMILHNVLPMQGLSVFGSDAWEKLGYTIKGEVPPISTGLNQVTRSVRRCFQGENGTLSFSAILMPKGLTFKKMKELMERKGIGFSYIRDVIERQLEDKPIEESYWLLMTNEMVEGSLSKNYSEQKELIDQKSESQCRLPTLLEAMAVCTMNKVRDGKYLFGKYPFTVMRCQQQIDGFPLVFGGYPSGYLFVDFDLFVGDFVGSAMCRQLC